MILFFSSQTLQVYTDTLDLKFTNDHTEIRCHHGTFRKQEINSSNNARPNTNFYLGKIFTFIYITLN